MNRLIVTFLIVLGSASYSVAIDPMQLHGIYQKCLNRNVDPAGVTAWSPLSYPEVEQGVCLSPEAHIAVAGLYLSYLGRPARPDEVSAWVVHNPVIGIRGIISGIYNSPEANLYRARGGR